MSSRPIDPRLLRRVGAARGYVIATALLGIAATACIVVQAVLVAGIISEVTAVTDGWWRQIRQDVGWLALAVLCRSVVAWGQERLGRRAAVRVIADLRNAVLARVTSPGCAPVAAGGREPDRAGLATLLTQGLDALDPYLTRYLPQLLLTATLTPAVLLVIVGFDGLSGLIIALTLPLIPLFMVLVGLATQGQAQRRLETLQRLGSQVLDLLAGLPTLRAFGREAAQARRVREVGEAYRRATMRTLRTAFLSALVLETLTTLSIALVAVAIGLRLVEGELDLRTGLTVLMLAPEVYLPLRMIGLHFHASADGLAAADQALSVLDDHPPGDHALTRDHALTDGAIQFRGVSVEQPGRGVVAPSGVNAVLQRGRITAITGASGCGKSTLLRAVLGLQSLDEGRIELDGVDVLELDRQAWWSQVTWLPQRPAVVPGTIRENVLLFSTETPDQAELDAAAAACGLDEVLAGAPDGWETLIGSGGRGVSAGQRQRIALARVFLAPRAVLLLDEPTAHLDAGTEKRVLVALQGLRAPERLIVLVAHRPSLVAIADDVVPVAARPAVQPDPVSSDGLLVAGSAS